MCVKRAEPDREPERRAVRQRTARDWQSADTSGAVRSSRYEGEPSEPGVLSGPGVSASRVARRQRVGVERVGGTTFACCSGRSVTSKRPEFYQPFSVCSISLLEGCAQAMPLGGAIRSGSRAASWNVRLTSQSLLSTTLPLCAAACRPEASAGWTGSDDGLVFVGDVCR